MFRSILHYDLYLKVRFQEREFLDFENLSSDGEEGTTGVELQTLSSASSRADRTAQFDSTRSRRSGGSTSSTEAAQTRTGEEVCVVMRYVFVFFIERNSVSAFLWSTFIDRSFLSGHVAGLHSAAVAVGLVQRRVGCRRYAVKRFAIMSRISPHIGVVIKYQRV